MIPRSLAVTAALALLALPAEPRAATKKALVVGVNAYGGGDGVTTAQRSFRALRGAVADAEAFAGALEKLGFQVTLLTDAQATRQGILDGIAALAADAEPGDGRVFYFAGHGSRVRNSLSPEKDQLDESILPVDVGPARNGKEVLDLRDKELARALNAIVDRNAILTVVLDSCHSGSATRGPPTKLVGVARQAAWDLRDVKDGSRPTPPETRGALVLSAAQDEQAAQEMGIPVRGVFTKALVDALAREGAADLPARALLAGVEDAVRRSTKETQVPVVAGSVQRQRATLLDARPAKASPQTLVRVRRQATGLFAEVQPLVPLGVGTVLERDAEAKRIQLVVARGEAAPGLVPVAPLQADATEAGTGAPYRIAKWMTPGDGVKIHVPAAMADAQLRAVRKTADQLAAAGFVLVPDPVDGAPTHRLEALSVGDKVEWFLTGPCVKNGAARGKDALALVRGALAAGAPACADRPAKPRLFVSVPPPVAVANELRGAWAQAGALAQLVEWPGDAAYVLAGRLEPDAVAYAFVRTASAPVAMPPRTDFFTTAAGSGGVESASLQLRDVGERLGRSFGWLALSGSDPVAQATFPYDLALRTTGSSELRGEGTTTKGGEAYDLVLRRSATTAAVVPRRYVYVFSLDSQGRRQLVFPRPENGDVENRFPLTEDGAADGAAKPPAEIVLATHAFDVGPPYGTDTFFLFASTTKLFNPLSLEDDGVRTRGTASEQDGYAEDVLRGVATRAANPSIPPQWALKKLTVTSVEK